MHAWQPQYNSTHAALVGVQHDGHLAVALAQRARARAGRQAQHLVVVARAQHARHLPLVCCCRRLGRCILLPCFAPRCLGKARV
jgi:hypothetical protein